MSFNWQHYLDFAEQISLNSQKECELRTAISRAYYAAYHACRGFMKGKGFTLPTGPSSHDRFLELMEDEGFADQAANLKRLKEHRVKADYILPFPKAALYKKTLQELTQYVVTESRSLIKSL